LTAPVGAAPGEPKIPRLVIERFRGILSLSWNPGAAVKVILGGGDAAAAPPAKWVLRSLVDRTININKTHMIQRVKLRTKLSRADHNLSL